MPYIPGRQLKSSDRTAIFNTVFFAFLFLANLGGILFVQLSFLDGPGWEKLTVLAVLHFSQVLVSEKFLAGFFHGAKSRLRLAFLASAGLTLLVLPVFLWMILGADAAQKPAASWVGVVSYMATAILAAFVAALLVTRRYMPLWENNLPPGEVTCQEVLHSHRDYPGIPEHPLTRMLDLSLAASGLILSSPFWLLCLLLIWLEDPGPVLFVKNSVGKGGRNFRQLKLRTMVHNAEAGTGPVLSPEFDQRVLMSGRFFRKTALDELPQLVNILKGEMSLVGPRPQRTVLVHEYLQSLPAYASRHRVLPGLAGLAQVAGDYYLTPRQKLRFDNLYIQHMSPCFDLKLLCLAVLIAFWFRWQNGWDGRLPRRLLHGTRMTS